MNTSLAPTHPTPEATTPTSTGVLGKLYGICIETYTLLANEPEMSKEEVEERIWRMSSPPRLISDRYDDP